MPYRDHKRIKDLQEYCESFLFEIIDDFIGFSEGHVNRDVNQKSHECNS